MGSCNASLYADLGCLNEHLIKWLVTFKQMQSTAARVSKITKIDIVKPWSNPCNFSLNLQKVLQEILQS